LRTKESQDQRRTDFMFRSRGSNLNIW